MDNNFIAFLPKDDPARIVNRHLETEYGEEITILVGLERPCGTIFDGPFTSRIREFFQAAGDTELVKTVNSLAQAQYITSDSESDMVTRFVDENFSGSPEAVAELGRRLASWDLYQGTLVSDDLSSTQIVITLDASSDEAGNPEVVAVLMRLRDMVKKMFTPYANVYTAG
jgi:predicted RND superfamily exporter protein